MKQVYVVEFNSMYYSRASEYCLVNANNEQEACDLAEEYANEFYYEQDHEQYLEDYGNNEDNYADDDEMYGNVIGAELLETSDHYVFATNPDQAQFYPKLN